jgi:hypothetical protein
VSAGVVRVRQQTGSAHRVFPYIFEVSQGIREDANSSLSILATHNVDGPRSAQRMARLAAGRERTDQLGAAIAGVQQVQLVHHRRGDAERCSLNWD